MIAVHEELRLGPGGSSGHAGRDESVQYRFLAPSAVVHFVAATGLGEHANALGRRRSFPEHRVTSGVRSTCEQRTKTTMRTIRTLRNLNVF